MPHLASTHYRPLHENDIALLGCELPSVLSGDWGETALRALMQSSHQLRVLQLGDGGEAGNEIVGFAEFLCVVDECQLYNIAVLPRWQRRGFGGRLLQALLAEAKSQAMNCCLLEVRESNTAARALYKAAGFSENGRRKAYYPPLPGAPPEREAAVLYSCLFDGGSLPAS